MYDYVTIFTLHLLGCFRVVYQGREGSREGEIKAHKSFSKVLGWLIGPQLYKSCFFVLVTGRVQVIRKGF